MLTVVACVAVYALSLVAVMIPTRSFDVREHRVVYCIWVVPSIGVVQALLNYVLYYRHVRDVYYRAERACVDSVQAVIDEQAVVASISQQLPNLAASGSGPFRERSLDAVPPTVGAAYVPQNSTPYGAAPPAADVSSASAGPPTECDLDTVAPFCTEKELTRLRRRFYPGLKTLRKEDPPALDFVVLGDVSSHCAVFNSALASLDRLEQRAKELQQMLAEWRQQQQQQSAFLDACDSSPRAASPSGGMATPAPASRSPGASGTLPPPHLLVSAVIPVMLDPLEQAASGEHEGGSPGVQPDDPMPMTRGATTVMH